MNQSISNQRKQIACLLAMADFETVLEILKSLGNKYALAELQRQNQILYAETLLKSGNNRTQTAARLVQRFGISQASAYNRISDYLNKYPAHT